ncbi:hypothetical protein BO94DRAFT_591266 [Aspergillus sclerotioniger CBS 115572]|uniref:Uncharacterized protein n=1 Tax=Aspergillus sclerotioniger CBS 115572 TaxID=1450535 RepID=A0A317UXI6_9EURO|nr:hypothetical protein BO94DRAFT_591266 [Aspergillus sclerotioniger CBS 115572]PWY66049.1 hypothetical protein BO94DRAFT_591266 [Aspergillus sclerotioniger CBS 115572]
MKFNILFMMTLLVVFVTSVAIPDIDDGDVDVNITLSDEDWSDLDLDFFDFDVADDVDDSDVVARDEDVTVAAEWTLNVAPVIGASGAFAWDLAVMLECVAAAAAGAVGAGDFGLAAADPAIRSDKPEMGGIRKYYVIVWESDDSNPASLDETRRDEMIGDEDPTSSVGGLIVREGKQERTGSFEKDVGLCVCSSGPAVG